MPFFMKLHKPYKCRVIVRLYMGSMCEQEKMQLCLRDKSAYLPSF